MGRLPRGKRLRATVLIATIVVVVAASAVGPGVLRDDGERSLVSAYDLEEQLPERAPAEGEVEVEPSERTGVVLVDISHRNRMSQDEIKPLLAGISQAGYRIDLLESDESFDDSLTRADAFVVIDPSSGYSDAEVNRLDAFVDRGGRLLMIGEPTTLDAAGFGVTLRVNRLTPLSSHFGFEFGEAYLYNMESNDGNFQNVFAEPVRDSRLTDGVSRTAFYAATRITVREGRTLLRAGPGTRSSRTDATGRYPVMAVNGNVLAIADGSFLTRGNYNVVDNEVLIRNVVRFLVGGQKRRALASYPMMVSEDPMVRYTRPALADAAQELAVDLRDEGHEPTLNLRRGPVSPNRTDVLITTYRYLERQGSLETGISVEDDFVNVPGYNSVPDGIIIVRAPASGYDLVIAADTPSRAERAVDMLVDGSLGDHRINRRTAVVRTAGVVS
ncbi:MAG: DUF4350 domain-containing protein [Halobacteriales archaeon]|nr:DUF4350 domain-containing protein [Halobacteriales archaeon]